MAEAVNTTGDRHRVVLKVRSSLPQLCLSCGDIKNIGSFHGSLAMPISTKICINCRFLQNFIQQKEMYPCLFLRVFRCLEV